MLFDPVRWLSDLPDDLPISEINIPGSHNAAAVNTVRRTRWTCQDRTIPEQLNRGIRLLDIRLKPKKRRNRPIGDQPDRTEPDRTEPGREPTLNPTREAYEFVTCHGRLGPFGANEFQSFESLLNECSTFLKANPRETIIITLQIDDYREVRAKNDPQILQSLHEQLNRYPTIHPPYIPTLSEARGNIFLINRINDNPELGVPITIPDNTPGEILTATSNRQYEVFVQDQYKRLNRKRPETHKLQLTIAAFGNKRPNNILLNFASGTKPFGRLIDIHKDLAAYLAAAHEPPHPLGWLLLDYPSDLPSFIINSNPKKPLTKPQKTLIQ